MKTLYREDICLQTLLLLFKLANQRIKRTFVLSAIEGLVGTLITIGDVNDIFPTDQVGLLNVVPKFESPGLKIFLCIIFAL